MPDVREVYEMVTKQKPPEPGALQRQQKRQVRTARNRKVGAFAIAAAIGLAAVVLIMANRPGGDTRTPADTPPTVYPVDPAAVPVAAGSSRRSALSTGSERSHIWPTTLASRWTQPRRRRCQSSFPSSKLGCEQIPVEACSATDSSAFGTSVRCRFDWHGIRSDEIGLSPYPALGSHRS